MNSVWGGKGWMLAKNKAKGGEKVLIKKLFFLFCSRSCCSARNEGKKLDKTDEVDKSRRWKTKRVKSWKFHRRQVHLSIKATVTWAGRKIPTKIPFKCVNTFSAPARLIIVVYSISWSFVQCSLSTSPPPLFWRFLFAQNKFVNRFLLLFFPRKIFNRKVCALKNQIKELEKWIFVSRSDRILINGLWCCPLPQESWVNWVNQLFVCSHIARETQTATENWNRMNEKVWNDKKNKYAIRINGWCQGLANFLNSRSKN